MDNDPQRDNVKAKYNKSKNLNCNILIADFTNHSSTLMIFTLYED